VYTDAVAVVLLPPLPRLRRSLPSPDEVLGDDPDRLLARAEASLQAGRYDEARARVEQALALDPLLLRAYGQLAAIHAREGDLAGLAAAIERGISAEPRERDKLRLLEAIAYEDAGRADLQLRALEAALPRGPFSRPRAIQDQIDELRRRVAAR
jgi:tetratricopeptide (TPR) repeat protein